MSEQVKNKKQGLKLCKLRGKMYSDMVLQIRKTENFLKKHTTHISIISFITLLAFILEPKLTELLSALNIRFICGLNQKILGRLIILSSIIFAIQLLLARKMYVPFWGYIYLLFPLLLYVYYRCFSSAFEFYYVCKSLAYTDVFFLLFYGAIIVFGIYRRLRKNSSQKQESQFCYILNDDAISSTDADLLGIAPLVRRLQRDLRSIDVSRNSFSVGISAPWGKGKTSFLNLLEQEIKAENDQNIIIWFNPRASKSSSYIQEDFFNTFSKELASYHFGFGFLVNRYVKLLGLLSENFIQRRFSQIMDLFIRLDDKERINQAIDAIGHRIYILIDDLDRLTGDELLEVFKIIGRNADFHHTIFLTAYDKQYVNEVLDQYLGSKCHQAYTDKYFAMELTVPEQSINSLTYWASQYLADRIEANKFVAKEEVLKSWNSVGNEVVRYLGSLRHIKRYINLFLSRYREVMADVDCIDFILVTLLRYKDPAIYNALSQWNFVERYSSLFNTGRLLCLSDSEEVKQKLRALSTWEYSYNILSRLFPTSENSVSSDTSTPIKEVYRCIRLVESFHLYFIDYEKSIAYRKDLEPLLEGSEDQALSRLKKLYALNQSGRVNDFINLELQSDIQTKDKLSRLIFLLAYATMLGGNPNFSFLGIFLKSQADTYIKQNLVSSLDEYKDLLNNIISTLIMEYPEKIGKDILLYLLESWIKDESEKPIYSKDELLSMIIECQEKYYSRSGQDDFNFDVAWRLAIVWIDESENYQSKRRNNLLALMKQQPDRFAEKMIAEIPDPYTDNTIYLIPKNYIDKGFKINKEEFDSWVSSLSDERLRFIWEILHREGEFSTDRRIALPIDTKYKQGDVNYLYGKLSQLYSLTPFASGDFVRRKNQKGLPEGSALQISKIEAHTVYVYHSKEEYPLSQILPVPIYDEIARDIYYHPTSMGSVLAPRQSKSIHTCNYNYFMDRFKEILELEDSKTLYDAVLEEDFRFVHEAQHWLRERFQSDDLKLRFASISKDKAPHSSE